MLEEILPRSKEQKISRTVSTNKLLRTKSIQEEVCAVANIIQDVNNPAQTNPVLIGSNIL